MRIAGAFFVPPPSSFFLFPYMLAPHTRSSYNGIIFELLNRAVVLVGDCSLIKMEINKMKNFNESAPQKSGNETRPGEGGFKPWRPEDGEEITYQFRYGDPEITVYKTANGIFVDRKIRNGLYAELLKSQQKEIKALCREIDEKCQAQPKKKPQEIANSTIK
jgi:hypothetical protein